MLPVLDQYLADLQHRPNWRGRSVSPATVRTARANFQGSIAWWEQTHRLSFDVALVLDRELHQWQLHRQCDDGAKPATINRANASLRAVVAWAQREELITHNPTADLHDRPSTRSPRAVCRHRHLTGCSGPSPRRRPPPGSGIWRCWPS